jgi:hypothetical protein
VGSAAVDHRFDRRRTTMNQAPIQRRPDAPAPTRTVRGGDVIGRPMLRRVVALAALVAAGAAFADRPAAGTGEVVAGLSQLVLTRSPVILGEIHGTAEVPALVGDVLASALADGGPLLLALEIPSSHQAQLDRYLEGAGSRAEREALFGHRFWGFRDGRSSVAMLALLDRVRALRAAGHALEVLAFDVAEPGAGPEREATLAANLAAALRRPDAPPVLVLTGNLHARRAIGTPFDPSLELMAWRLRELAPLSLNVRAPTGSAWVCAPECGVLRLGEDREPGEPSLRLFDVPSSAGYDGEVTLARFTASMPANEVDRAKAD